MIRTCSEHLGEIQYDGVIYLECPLCKVKKEVDDVVGSIKVELNIVRGNLCVSCDAKNIEPMSELSGMVEEILEST